MWRGAESRRSSSSSGPDKAYRSNQAGKDTCQYGCTMRQQSLARLPRTHNVRVALTPTWSHCAVSSQKTMKLHSVITCPKCGTAKLERMPTDACQFFYNCTGCGERLKANPGDCCVFCSYGSIPCPAIQAHRSGDPNAGSGAR